MFGVNSLKTRKKFLATLEVMLPKIAASEDVYEVTSMVRAILELVPRDGVYKRELGEDGKIFAALVEVSNIKAYKAKSIECLEYLAQESVNAVKRIEDISPEEKEKLLKKQKEAIKAILSNDIPKWEVKPDEGVEFTHNGGLNYILQFLTGKNDGYRLETQDYFTGIQVMNTSGSERALQPVILYLKNALYSFDIPVMIKGIIKGKFLDLAPNAYEAGIRACYADQIQITSIKLCLNICNLGYRGGEKIITNPKTIQLLQKVLGSEIFKLSYDKSSPLGWKYYDVLPYHKCDALDLAVTDDQCLIGEVPIEKLP